MMSIQGKSSKHRVYSAEEIEKCLHFVKLPIPIVPISSSSSPTIEWWPCLVFANIMELKMVTKQLGLWPTLLMGPTPTMKSYIKLLPESANCRVALSMGQQPPSGNPLVLFDISNQDATMTSKLILEPFYENVFPLNELYDQNNEYVRAVQQTFPLLQEVTESSRPDTGINRTNEENCYMTKNSAQTSTDEHDIEAPSVDVASQKIVSSDKSNTTLRKPVAGDVTENNVTVERSSRSSRDLQRKAAVVVDVPERKPTEATLPSKTRSLPPSKVATNCKPTIVPNKNVEFVEIPLFKDVKQALLKGGYSFNAKNVCRPPIVQTDISGKIVASTPSQRFASVKALRNDLCIYGVNCRCGISMDEEKACQCWTIDEKWDIKLWVRYNVIRGLINVSSPVQVISSIHNATKYLIRLGYNRQLLKSTLTTEDQRKDLFRYFSQYGLPHHQLDRTVTANSALHCDYTRISPEERFSLEYFISTSPYRVKTFTYMSTQSDEPTPPILTMELDSPTPSSVARPKRTVVLRQQQMDDTSVKRPKVTHHESGATIVSIESSISNSTTSDSRLEPDSGSLEKKTKNIAPNERKSTVKSQRNATSDESGFVSYDSPILRSTMSYKNEKTKENVPQQRVSLSPMLPPMTFEKVITPVFEGSDHDKLHSCLKALNPANLANLPTICSSNEVAAKKSKFAMNILEVANFVRAVQMSSGRNGTGHITDESSAALYVCGAPGLGKTCGVHWCCNNVAKSSTTTGVKINVCHVNAAYLTSQSTPLRFVINVIAKSVGIKAVQPSESDITKFLKDTSKSAVLMIVVDEIDAFVTGNGRTTAGGECLRTLLGWANNAKLRVGLIGISNCMNDDNIEKIEELGVFVKKVIFSPYSEYELQKILQARVGTAVVAPNVIDYIAKKVATSTGDARKALEMAANAVQHKIDQSSCSTTESTDGHLVKMPNVIQANKEAFNLKERISGQPVVGKVILCVLTSYAQTGGAVDTTIGELKQCVSECMRQTGMEDEMVQMEDFLVLLETLVDSGLLRASSATKTNNKNGLNLSRRTLSDVHRQPIRLGIQLDDIEKVLESDLKEAFYQNLRDRARTRRQDE